MATRRELVAFDKKRPADSISSTSAKVVGRCYGKFSIFQNLKTGIFYKYFGDCRNSFEELSKIIQKVMATRRELVAFDKKRPADSISSTSAKVVGRCYGKFSIFQNRKTGSF